MPALDGSELLLSHESTCSALAKGWVWMSKQISYFCTFCAQKKKKWLWAWKEEVPRRQNCLSPNQNSEMCAENPALSCLYTWLACLTWCPTYGSFLAWGSTISLASWPSGTIRDPVGNTMVVSQVQGVGWGGEIYESHPSRSCRFPSGPLKREK